MTPQEREARLRAARRLQDDIYQGIGATDRPDVDGRGPTSAAGGRVRDAARDSATSMTRAGTQPLRDLLAQPDDRTARMAAMDDDEDDSRRGRITEEIRGRRMTGDMPEDERDSMRRGISKFGKKPKGGY